MFCDQCIQSESCQYYIDACRNFCMSGAEDHTAFESLEMGCVQYKEAQPSLFQILPPPPRVQRRSTVYRRKYRPMPSLYAA